MRLILLVLSLTLIVSAPGKASAQTESPYLSEMKLSFAFYTAMQEFNICTSAKYIRQSWNDGDSLNLLLVTASAAIYPFVAPPINDVMTYSPMIGEVEQNASIGVTDLAQSPLYAKFLSEFQPAFNQKKDVMCASAARNLANKLNAYLNFKVARVLAKKS